MPASLAPVTIDPTLKVLRVLPKIMSARRSDSSEKYCTSKYKPFIPWIQRGAYATHGVSYREQVLVNVDEIVADRCRDGRQEKCPTRAGLGSLVILIP